TVVVPFLQHEGIYQVDTLVLSHGDADHSGGVPSVLKTMKVKQLLTSVPERYVLPITNTCERGQYWKWDGINFEVLNPSVSSSHRMSGNNRSCVVKVSVDDQHSILLTGDIE